MYGKELAEVDWASGHLCRFPDLPAPPGIKLQI